VFRPDVKCHCRLIYLIWVHILGPDFRLQWRRSRYRTSNWVSEAVWLWVWVCWSISNSLSLFKVCIATAPLHHCHYITAPLHHCTTAPLHHCTTATTSLRHSLTHSQCRTTSLAMRARATWRPPPRLWSWRRTGCASARDWWSRCAHSLTHSLTHSLWHTLYTPFTCYLTHSLNALLWHTRHTPFTCYLTHSLTLLSLIDLLSSPCTLPSPATSPTHSRTHSRTVSH
jgi:hypothetical protein